MPFPLIPVLVGAAGALAVGGGVKLAGDGIEDAGEGIRNASTGARDLAIAGAVVFASYLVLVNKGVIKRII